MTKYKYGNPEAPIVLIQPVGDHDLPEIEGEVAQIRKLTAQKRNNQNKGDLQDGKSKKDG